jgi:fibronectin-binding autotransporter adhesin
MADRYWVGGTGSWNSTSKWSTTSGGASGASVPTATDNAIFDANSSTSNAYVVTIQASQTCADLTYTPFAGDGATQFSIIGTFVIAGTFSTSGTQGNRRLWLLSSTESLMRDVSIATIGTVTDVDFRDIRITGAGGTLTGTRIGDLKGNVGITFSTPKNCFRIGTGNWSDDQWSDTSGGSVSTDNFPLAQDTAVFDESTTGGTHTMNSAIPYTGTVDMSARTSALTLSLGHAQTIYGNWTFGSGITLSGGLTLNYSGRNTQTITSAGKTFPGSLVVNSFGGTVELADAYNGNAISVNNGTFITNNYNVTIINSQSFNAESTTPAALLLGSSTVTISGSMPVNTTNFTFDAGTSTIIFSGNSSVLSGALTLYNVQATNPTNGLTVKNSCTFNNLEITAPTSLTKSLKFGDNQVITGTLTVSGASEIRRLFVLASDSSNNPEVGLTRTLTVGTLLADYCDFRDITIAGTAAGGSPTNAGDCGGNSGVTFPAPKTVYWNFSGTRSWEANGWATTSGGTPDVANFPLAQDTAVFDDTGAASIVSMKSFNVGAVDMSARTTSMQLLGAGLTIYGDWSFGTGVITSSSAGITFAGQGTTTITSNGVEFGLPVTFDCGTGTVQLADAFAMPSVRTLTLPSGTFDAVSYNVTVGKFSCSSNPATGQTKGLKMGSGLWTITGTGAVWNLDQSTFSTGIFDKGTADILLSDTSTTARTFTGNGGGSTYNKLTIGGATGTSTLTISGNSQFTELASTKTVAHTIALGSTAQTFGKWSVTGTSGNVVTLTGTGVNHQLRGACTDGIDYLAMGSIGFNASSTAEFYAGANSTGTAAAPVYRTAKPADSTRYWVGGTGNWNDTNSWSTTSGGAGGADLPRSHDDVVFDSASNATAYTATVNAITGGNRCKALTIAGPASGNVTLAGSTALFIHDDITLPATGLTRTYTGAITLSGTGAGKTITTNGVSLNSNITLDGVGAEWALGSSLTLATNSSAFLTLTNGELNTANYNITVGSFRSISKNAVSVILGSSTISLPSSNSQGWIMSNTAVSIDAGTSTIIVGTAGAAGSLSFDGGSNSYYNVELASAGLTNCSFLGTNTFNNLSVAGRTTAGIANINLSADQTINGTLTLSAGTNATMRTFVRSNTIGTTRTLTCAAVDTLSDIDFRDITIAGAAVSGGNLTGTRLGDGKGNSGITFDAGVNKYWNLAGGGNWSSTAWATSSGGAVSNDNFPLAQDTCIFEAGSPNSGNTATINAGYNIGTIDMSARTTNTMTLACSPSSSIYGNWTNGTGVTFSGTGILTFAGRGSQTITSAGRTFTQQFTIDTPGGSVTLQDAFETDRNSSSALRIDSGTFDANIYNCTLPALLGGLSSTNSNTRTIAIGSGTWTMAGSGTPWNTQNINGLTVTGTGTLSFTSASTKTFSAGSNTSDFSGTTINQGGSGQLNFNSFNTFANITNTYSATGATTISFGATAQRVANFTATGTAGNVLTIQGSSATSPCNLIHTGAGDIILDYLNLIGVRAYQI